MRAFPSSRDPIRARRLGEAPDFDFNDACSAHQGTIVHLSPSKCGDGFVIAYVDDLGWPRHTTFDPAGGRMLSCADHEVGDPWQWSSVR